MTLYEFGRHNGIFSILYQFSALKIIFIFYHSVDRYCRLIGHVFGIVFRLEIGILLVAIGCMLGRITTLAHCLISL